jgi:sialate O-acetylesterase
MILQRKPHAAVLWGIGAPAGSIVTVSLSPAQSAQSNFTAVVADSGAWQVRLAPQPASIANITVRCLANVTRLVGVRFGELLLCAGQSNMDMQIRQADNATEEIEAAKGFPNLHLFKVGAEASAVPTDFIHGEGWKTNDNESVAHFSAACYFAGRSLQQSLQKAEQQEKSMLQSKQDPVTNIPVGMVQASWCVAVLNRMFNQYV